jgi:hypothetical protein
MGFQATVVVLLDRLQDIENDAKFGKKLAEAIRYRATRSAEYDKPGTPGYKYCGAEATGQTEVIEVHHADDHMVVAVGGNCGRVLGYGGSWPGTKLSDDKAIMKNLRADLKRRNQDGNS